VHDRAGKFFLCSTGHLPNPAVAFWDGLRRSS